MKLLLVTDTHLGIYQSSDLYHGVVLNLFKEIKEYCRQNDIKTVLHLGDFFHERRVLNTKTQFVAHMIASLFDKDVNMKIILGNHDVYYKTKLEPTTLDIFKNYDHVEVIKETVTFQDISLVPWSLFPKKKSGYVFGHFEFTGFKMNTNYVCERGLDPTDWKQYDHIYSGHFHWPSTRGNITYLGSSYPHNFHDVDSPRGYYVWEDGEIEFIEYQGAPKFVKLNTENVDNSKIKGNIVKLIFDKDYGSIENQKMIDEALSFKPVKLQPDFSQVKMEGTDETIETTDASLLDHEEILNEYIEKTEVPVFCNKATLMNMITQLKEEIKQ